MIIVVWLRHAQCCGWWTWWWWCWWWWWCYYNWFDHKRQNDLHEDTTESVVVMTVVMIQLKSLSASPSASSRPLQSCKGNIGSRKCCILGSREHVFSVSKQTRQARFPFKRNRLRCVRCVNENRKKRKRLLWQAANHGCHCFDWAFLLAGACVCCVKFRQQLKSCLFRDS